MKRRAEELLFCKLCNFSTTFSSHLQRHNNTEKHLRNCRIAISDEGLSCQGQIYQDTDVDKHKTSSNLNVEEENTILEKTVSSSFSDKDDDDDDGVGDDGVDDDDDGDDESDDDDVLVTDIQSNDQPWFPFKSKLQMYLYILIHSKTHTLSDETAKFIWFIIKESGIEMPSFSSVKSLRISGDIKPESLLSREESKDGNPFWIIKPSALVSMALSHPDTATDLHRYGRVSSDGQTFLEEQADGGKWVKEIQTHYASNGQRSFFSGDFVSSSTHDLEDIGQICTFLQDIQYDILYAKVKIFRRSTIPGLARKSIISMDRFEMWNIGHLSTVQKIHEYTFYKSVNENVIQVTDDEKNSLVCPNPHILRCQPVYTVPLNLFMDDTSANKSKKWKPLHCIQLQLAGIPKAKKQTLSSIKFVSASAEVPILEMARVTIDDIKNSEGGILTFDANGKEKVTVIPFLSLCVCDFNMMAEASNHMGANTYKFCPRCYADKDSSIWKGTERDPVATKRILDHLDVNNSKELRQNHGLKPYPNPLWNILNPHRDIPVGILHWLYLGIGKHLLKACIQELPEMKQEQLCMLIESCNQSAFETKISRDTIIYIDSRQGKDIKTYLQIAPLHFAVVGLERNKVDLLCQLAEISKILTCKKEFSDYSLESLQDRIDTYLLGIRNYFPHLQQKVKTHLSVHVVDDILDHGPMDAYKEDAFEKMHGRIRDQLFNQNSHARSRDTAIAFAEMEVLNHILTGGFFPNGEEWLQASDLVQKTSSSQEVRGFLGMPSSEDTSNSMKLRKAINRERGSLVWETVDDDTVQILSSTCSSRNINFTGAKRSKFRSLKTKADQLANKGTPVLINVDDNTEEVGIFQEGWLISTREGARIQLAQIQKVELKNSARIAKTLLERVVISEEFLLVPVSNVLSILSLVHDCLSEGCHVKDGFLNVCVEQEMKEVRKKFWKHKNNAVYLLNKFSFANARCKYFD